MIRYILVTLLCVGAMNGAVQTREKQEDPIISMFKKQEINIKAFEGLMLEQFRKMQGRIDVVNTGVNAFHLARKLNDKIDMTATDLADKLDKTILELAAKLNNKIDMTTKDLAGKIHEAKTDLEEKLVSITGQVEEAVKVSNTTKGDIEEQLKLLDRGHKNILSRLSTMCPTAYTSTSYGCYKISTEKATWDDAKRKCTAEGAHLLALETQDENKAFYKWLKPRGIGGSLWIGGNDKATEGQWVWDGSGVPFTYTNWEPGQPNGGSTDNCIYISSYNDKWWDWSCSSLSQYICEL